MWYATTTAGSGQGSRTVTRFSRLEGGSLGMSRGTGGSAFGTRPRYCGANWAACGVANSPPGGGAVGFRHAPEILRDQLDGLRGVEVPREGDRGVLRNVVGLVEIADVLDRRGQIGRASCR